MRSETITKEPEYRAEFDEMFGETRYTEKTDEIHEIEPGRAESCRQLEAKLEDFYDSLVEHINKYDYESYWITDHHGDVKIKMLRLEALQLLAHLNAYFGKPGLFVRLVASVGSAAVDNPNSPYPDNSQPFKKQCKEFLGEWISDVSGTLNGFLLDDVFTDGPMSVASTDEADTRLANDSEIPF